MTRSSGADATQGPTAGAPTATGAATDTDGGHHGSPDDQYVQRLPGTSDGLRPLRPHEAVRPHGDQQRHLHLRRRGVDPPARPGDPALATAGLDEAAVATRHELGLTNRQPKDTSRSIWAILRVHLLTLFNLAIAACAVAVIVLGRWLDLVFCLAAVANVVIGVVQEHTAKRKLDRIALLHRDAATVIRSGAETPVRLEHIVLDDAVVLRRGDQVPADGTVLVVDGLDLDESLLTGESEAVGKLPGDPVLSGSAVISGHGIMRVTAVGADSHASQLAVEARRFSRIHSELRAGLDTVAKWLTIALVPIVAVILHGQVRAVGGWGHALDNDAMEPAVVASVAAITAMIPQGLALMTTISFAVAALKLAQHEVLIQDQPAVELLARVDTVCLDKTGTLTEGGIVFDDVTEVSEAATQDGGTHDGAWRRVLAWFGADPNANPTAGALGGAFTDVPAAPPSAQVAFASARRWSAVAFDAPGAGTVHDTALHGAWVLGAPEALLEDARYAPGRRASLEEACRERTDRGLRTMLLCRSSRPAAVGSWFGTKDELPPELEPVALLTFRELVREDAPETLQYFRDQGVQLKLLSGDHPRTVAAVAREVGLDVEGHGFDARELPEDETELAEVLETHSVFGRVSPDQKKGMVAALQSAGHVVAMAGDGINDALALKTADLGIAMGNGAPATKAVSRMVLLDDRFARLPAVLAEGRKVIANMERLAHMFLTKTAYALLFGVVFSLLAWPFPLLPRQTSTVDALMIGVPTFFLALMPNPRRYVKGFMGRALRFAIPTGVVILLGMLAINAYARWWAPEVSVQQLQTASVITLTLMGLWALNAISRPLNRWKVLLIGSMYVLLYLALTVPLSQRFHQFQWPTTDLTVAAVVIGAAGCVLIETVHRWHHARLRLAPEDPRPAA